MNETELFHKMMDGYDGSEAEKERIWKVLKEANVSEDFQRAAFVIAETQTAAPHITTAVQNSIGEQIFKRSSEIYKQGTSAWDKDPMFGGRERPTPASFFAHNPDAFSRLQDQPIDLSWERWARNPTGPQILGERFPTAYNNLTNVREAMNYLTLTEAGSVWQQVTKPYRNEAGEMAFRSGDLNRIMEEYNVGMLGGLQSLASFNPMGGKSSVAVHFSANALNAVKRERNIDRAERSFFQGNGAFDSEDSEGGLTINGETGEALGDVGMSAAEAGGRAINDLGGWESRQVFPPGDPGEWENWMLNQQGGNPEENDILADFNARSGLAPTAWDLNSERPYTSSRRAGTWVIGGVDPNSAFAKYGGREGDMWVGAGQITKNKDLALYLAALENGMPAKFNVQRMENGVLNNVELSVPVNMFTGRTVDNVRQNNWIENLAGQVEPVPSYLYTTQDNYSSGMYKDPKGNWSVAPLSREPSEQYNVPVQFKQGPTKAFGQMWETMDPVWDEWSNAYKDVVPKAREKVLQQGRDFMTRGKYPEGWKYETALQNEINTMLPREVPRMGSPEYNTWQNANLMLTELSDIQGMLGGGSAPEPEENTIDIWDQVVSSQERTTNPAAYSRKIAKGAGQLNWALQEVEAGPAFLALERSQQYALTADRLSNPAINRNPGGAPSPYRRLTSWQINGGTGGFSARGGAYTGPGGTFASENFYPVGYNHPAVPGIKGEKVPPRQYVTDPAWGDLPAVDDRSQMVLSAYSSVSNKNFINAFPLGSMNEDDWDYEQRKAQIPIDPKTGKPVPGMMAYPNYKGAPRVTAKSRYEPRTNEENTYDNSVLGGDPSSDEYLDADFELNKRTRQNFPFDGRTYNIYTREPIQYGPWQASSSVDDANEGNTTDPLMQLRMQAAAVNNYRKGEELVTDNEEAVVADIQDQTALMLIPDPDNPNTSTVNRIAGIGMRQGYYHTPWRSVTQDLNADNPDASWTYNAVQHTDAGAKRNELIQYLNTFAKTGRKDLYMKTRLGEMPDDYKRFSRATNEGRGASYRTTLRMISDQYDLGLSLKAGEEDTLFDQIQTLSKDPDKQAEYQAVTAAYAEPGEQFRAMLQYKSEVPAVAQPGPKKGTGAEAHEYDRQLRAKEAERQAQEAARRAQSHSNLTPGGRSQAKYSPADLGGMRGDGMRQDPITGEMVFDPVYETPPAARFMRAANPAGAGGAGGPPDPPETPPDVMGEPPDEEGPENTPPPQRTNPGQLTEGQRKILYAGVNESKLQSQVGWFLSDKNQSGRDFFNVIVNDKASKGLIGGLRGALEGEFDQQGFAFSDWEQVDDPSLPAGYAKYGGRVTPASANGNGNEHSGAGNSQAAPTPQPARPEPNRDPAAFPMTPGAAGMKMTFTRYDPKTKHGASVTAWSRDDGQGNVGWYVPNGNGELEPLEINKGWGRVYDESGNLTYDVTRDAREKYDFDNMPLASAGNSGPAARTIIEDPAQFPEAAEGRMIKFRPQGGGEMYLHAAQDPNTQEWGWASRSETGGGNELAFRRSPGYGQVTENGKVIADVPRADYERHMAGQATVIAKDPPTAPPSRQPQTPPPMRTQLANQSAAFSRFNLALNDANAIFSGRLYASENGNRYGINPDDSEGFRRGIQNEFYDRVAASWNQIAANPVGSVEDAAEILSANLGVDEELVSPAAQMIYEEQQRLASHGSQSLQKEGALRAGTPRRARDANNQNPEAMMAATGRGAPGWRSLAQDRVSGMDLNAALSDFSSPSLGVATFTTFEDASGVTRSTRNIARPTDDGFIETVSPENVSKANNMAQKAYTDATSGALPQGDPDAIMATIKERMYSSLQKSMLEEIKNGEGNGLSRTDATYSAQIVREVAEHITRKAGEEVKKSLGETVGEVSAAASERHDTRVANVDDAKAFLDRSPRARAALGGRSLQEVMDSRDETVLLDENDRQLTLGGESGARYAGGNAPATGREHIGRGPGSGMGKFGSTMYGLYMLKREWQMAGAPVFQEAEKYAQGLESYGALMGDGQSLIGTDAGFTARQELGQQYMGKAAYSQFGAFMDLPYQLSQSGNLGAARMLETGGVAGGLAFGANMTGSMLKQWPGMEGAGNFVAKAGMGIAAGVMGVTAGMEIYNAIPDGNWFKPEGAPSDWTISSVIDRVGRLGGIQQAANKRVEAEFGSSFEDYKAKQEAAGKPLEYNAYSWNNAYHEKTNIWTGGHDFAGDTAYMDPKDIQKFLDGADNAKIADLETSLTSIRKDHGEQGTSLTKAALMQKQAFGATDKAKLDRVSAASMALGITSDVNLNEGMGYAANLGYLEGSDEFEAATYEFAENTDRADRGQKKYEQARWAQYGSQIQNYFGADPKMAGIGARVAKQYGLDNQARMGNVSSGLSMVERFYGKPTEADAVFMSAISESTNAYVGGVIQNAMQAGAMAGLSRDDNYALGGILSSAWASAGSQMSNQDASIYSQMMQGDMGAYSFQAWQSGNMGNAFFDQAGRSIVEHNGAVAMQVYNNWAPRMGTGDGKMTSAQFLGTSNKEITNTFEQGGFYGLQRLASQKSYDASMASVGVQMKGIALQEQYLWGQDDGGSWNSPTTGSYWGIEDRMTANQRASQQANFDDQWQRMQISNSFGIQRENNQFTRMQANNAYQNWQFSQQYNQFQQGLQWTQQDWQYQDTTRQLNFGWQMEDLNENIRFASGRQRKQLVKQRDRAALTENLEEDNVETQRDRQKQLWAQQEEQYQKQKQYMAQIQSLDLESFNINKSQRETFYKMDAEAYNRRLKEYEEETKLQNELKELQRKYQHDQIQLQKEAAGAQAAAAQAQKDINDAITNGQENWQKNVIGPWTEMNKYDNAFRIINATKEMLTMANTADKANIDRIILLLNTISSATPRNSSSYDPRNP